MFYIDNNLVTFVKHILNLTIVDLRIVRAIPHFYLNFQVL